MAAATEKFILFEHKCNGMMWRHLLYGISNFSTAEHEACPGISQQRRSFPSAGHHEHAQNGPCTRFCCSYMSTHAGDVNRFKSSSLYACIWPLGPLNSSWQKRDPSAMIKSHQKHMQPNCDWGRANWQLSPIMRRNMAQTCHMNKSAWPWNDLTVPVFSFCIGGRWVQNSLVFLHLNHTFCVELNLCKPKVIKTCLKVLIRGIFMLNTTKKEWNVWNIFKYRIHNNLTWTVATWKLI